ncbi:YojF family protein [Alicyclobacillus tolerans]|uniref:YojF family protein n=1 Tax=Alicyclobacillus tolerans TaxID=90970 RepID=UPI001F1FCC7B|nr:YojF family protein [Alicyclobacillus tolerans]MCF8564097.1 YojF family protein [Alicyclobacillus tolerans]
MEAIRREEVQTELDRFVNQEVYLHLETTNGAYAAHRGENSMAVCAYIRNGQVRFHRGTITGNGPYRVGLKMEQGWIYAEGLTDFEVDGDGRLLLAGNDSDGRLAVSLELSTTPFPM